MNDILGQIGRLQLQLDKLNARHILPTFEDRSDEKLEIEAVTNDITSLFFQVQSILSRLSKNLDKISSTHAESIIAKNILQGLAFKIQTKSLEFRKSQSKYLSKICGAAMPSYKPSKFDLEDEFTSISPGSLELSEQVQVGNITTDIQKREKEINEIASSIVDLSTIFKDISAMVIDQGTLLDRIDYNVENSFTSLKNAYSELNNAEKSQSRSSRCLKRSAILLLILFIIILTIVLFVKLGNR